MAAPRVTLPLDVSGEDTLSDELVLCSQCQTPLVIHKALMAELANSVNEGVRAVPRGGAEVGGLLVASGTRRGFVRVGKILPVPIEHRFGPGFRPSPNDLAAFQRAASLQQADTVVGFYRSATRDPKYLRDTDNQILAAIEQGHPSYARDFRFLMILTSVSKSSMLAEVATCQEGAWQQWQPHTLNLPLLPDKPMPESSSAQTRPDSLASAEPVTRPLRSLAGALRAAEVESPNEKQPGPAPLAPPPLVPPSAPAINPAIVAMPAREKSRSRPPLFLYPSMALVLLLGLSGVYYGFDARRKAVRPLAPPAAASVRISRMGFAANPEGSMWKLTWNRDAVTALNPSSASLSIRDGSNEQQIPLTTAELGAGMVFYTPQSGDLVFGLKLLLREAPPEEEKVRVLQAIRPSQTPAEPSVQIMASDHRIRTVRPFRPPPQVRQQPDLDLIEPPAIVAENKIPAAPAISVLAAPAAPLPAVRTTIPYAHSAVPQNLSIVPPLPSPAPPPPSPAEAKPDATAAVSYVPPKALLKIAAKLPPEVIVGNPTVVQVKVEINAAGKVTKATPLKVNATNYALVNSAVRAAESWDFAPALENGRPVASDTIVVFQFAAK
jgi:periplasmic protein TonB